MEGFFRAAIRERKVTIFLAVMAAIFGLYSYYSVPKQENPDTSSPVALITTIYPGASPEEVEKLVTNKIEDAASEIEGFESVTSQSKNSASVVIVNLYYDADIDKAWSELRQKMEDLKAELPEGCLESRIDTRLMDTAAMIISLSGSSYSYEQLASFAEGFKKELGKIKGVSRIKIDGKLEKEVKVNVDMEKLSQYDVCLEDIAGILKIQNVDIPSGSIDYENSRINISTPGRFNSLSEIENVIISASEEGPGFVRLKDVAEVHFDYGEGSYKFRHNGENTILITGYFEKDRNIVIIGKDVRKELDKLKVNLPEDVVMSEVIYQPEDVDNSVRGFTGSLIQGMLFVILVVFLGIGFRNALVVSAAIPLSMLITFIVMNLAGIDMQFVSIAALVISLGILVDNAIVICESIQNYIEEGLSNTEAAIEAVKETAVPIFTSTLTTVAAFATLLIVPGMPGKFMSSVPIVVITALSASYIVAMTVTPAAACLFFKKSGPKKARREGKDYMAFLRKFFEGLLDFGLKKRITTLFIAVGLLAVSLGLIPKLGLQFFPLADKNIVYVNIESETFGNLQKTEDITNRVEEILKSQEEVISFTSAIGNGLPKFYLTMPISVASRDFAQIMIRLDLKKGERFKENMEFVSYLQDELDKKVVGGTAKVKALEYAALTGAPVTIIITSDNMDKLKQVSEELQSKLMEMPGTMNVRDDAVESSNEFMVDIDPEIIQAMGLTKYDVVKQINTALSGTKASVYRKNGSEYDIVVKSNIKSLEELKNLSIKSSLTGSKILIKQVAEILLKPTADSINHADRDMAVTVLSDVKPGYSPVVIQDQVEKNILMGMDLEDVNIKFKGEKDLIIDIFGSMAIAAVFALIGIYVILLMEFNSFVQPFIILLTVPLSFIGCILGLLIFKKPLSATAAMGVVSLIGIVVNNAILLIEFINAARSEGKSLDEACKEAVGRRFRPIVLTTGTTVMGLIPLVISGNPMFGPMSIVLMVGLLISTILTLVIIPVIYNLFESRVLKADRPEVLKSS